MMAAATMTTPGKTLQRERRPQTVNNVPVFWHFDEEERRLFMEDDEPDAESSKEVTEPSKEVTEPSKEVTGNDKTCDTECEDATKESTSSNTDRRAWGIRKHPRALSMGMRDESKGDGNGSARNINTSRKPSLSPMLLRSLSTRKVEAKRKKDLAFSDDTIASSPPSSEFMSLPLAEVTPLSLSQASGNRSNREKSLTSTEVVSTGSLNSVPTPATMTAQPASQPSASSDEIDETIQKHLQQLDYLLRIQEDQHKRRQQANDQEGGSHEENRRQPLMKPAALQELSLGPPLPVEPYGDSINSLDASFSSASKGVPGDELRELHQCSEKLENTHLRAERHGRNLDRQDSSLSVLSSIYTVDSALPISHAGVATPQFPTNASQVVTTTKRIDPISGATHTTTTVTTTSTSEEHGSDDDVSAPSNNFHHHHSCNNSISSFSSAGLPHHPGGNVVAAQNFPSTPSVVKEPVVAPARKTSREIEICPGYFLPLRGVDETLEYLGQCDPNLITSTFCFACNHNVYVLADAAVGLCPTCRLVLPLEETCQSKAGYGVSLGFLADDRDELQAVANSLRIQ